MPKDRETYMLSNNDLYQMSLYELSRGSEKYLQCMVTNCERIELKSAEDFEYVDLSLLSNEEGHQLLIKFQGEPDPFCYDVLFLKHLPPNIQSEIYKEYKEQHKRQLNFSAEYKQLLQELRWTKLQQTPNKVNIHTLISHTIQDLAKRADAIRKKLDHIKKSDRDTGIQLEKMSTLMKQPIRIQFRLLLLQSKIKCLTSEEQKELFKNYCHMTPAALNHLTQMGFNSLQLALDKEAVQFEKIMEELANLPSDRNRLKSNWHGAFSLDMIQNEHLAKLIELSKHWHELKYQEFPQHKKNLDVENYQRRFDILKNHLKNGADQRKKQNAYGQLLNIIRQLKQSITVSVDPNSSLYKGLSNDLILGKIDAKAESKHKKWIWDNCYKLGVLYTDLLGRLQLLIQNNVITVPQTMMKQFEAFPIGNQTQTALSELTSHLNNPMPKQMKRALASHQAKDKVLTLEELVQLHRKISEECDLLEDQDTAFFLKLYKTYPNPSEREDYLCNLYKELGGCLETRAQLGNEIMRDFESLPRLQQLDDEIIDYYLELSRRRLIFSLLDRDFKVLDINHFQKRFDQIKRISNDQEQQVQWNILFQQLKGIPPLDKIETFEKMLDPKPVYSFQLDTNTIAICELKDNVLALLKVRNQQLNTALFFNTCCIEDCSADTLRQELVLLEESFLDIYTFREEEPLMDSYRDLQNRLLHAQDFCAPGPKRQGVLLDFKTHLNNCEFNPKNCRDIFDQNFKQLKRLGEETNRAIKRLYEYQAKLGMKDDFEYLNYEITIDDLRKLHKEYDIIMNIPVVEIQRFKACHENFKRLMERLFKDVQQVPSEIHPELVRLLDANVCEFYTLERKLSASNKMAILALCDSIREADFTKLCYFANYTEFAKFRKQTTFKTLSDVVALIKERDPKTKQRARRIIGTLKTALSKHEPRYLHKNYENNRCALLKEINTIIDGN